jgi:hypothetical protein
MGVLDDAIREHLELKRRHGAGEDELRRQEEEALGPARREVAPAESDDGNQVEAEHAEEPELSEVIPAEAVHSDVHSDQPGSEDPVAELPVEDPVDEAGAPDTTASESAPPEEEHAELGDTPQQGFERVEEEEDAPAELPEEELPEDDDLEELEDDDGHPEGDDEEYGDDEDVLEETPDFLQETPEHDRLWFEQKPPRDFDFD